MTIINNMAKITKADLEAENKAQKEYIKALEKKAKSSKKSKKVTGKIQQGTNFVEVCKVGDYSVSFMPQNERFSTPALWLSKGRNGVAVPATNTGMETLEALIIEIREKAELTA